MKYTKFLVLLLAILFVTSTLLWRYSDYRFRQLQERIDNIKADTVTLVKVKIDTQWFPKPVPQIVEVVDSVPYPVYVKGDPDTVYLEKVKKVYVDSSYYAVVSGVDPNLDTIAVYNKTVFKDRFITNTVKVPTPYRWSISLNAGYGLTFDLDEQFKVIPGPTISVGLSYNLLSW